jgi:hypothetical protein
MSNFETLTKFIDEKYEKNPVLRGLIQLVPFGIGSAIDASLSVFLQNVYYKRTRIFFNELAEGKKTLTAELLESEDFLHCFFATTKAALNSRRTEKIKMFARLLNSVIEPNSFFNTDEYEEYLNILDELSLREILILFTLESYESKLTTKPEPGKIKFNELIPFWTEFENDIHTNLGIPKNEIDAVLTRLVRTGCYELFTGEYIGGTKGKGRLTPTFLRLKTFLQEDNWKAINSDTFYGS